MAKAQEAKEVASAGNLMDQVGSLLTDAKRIAANAEKAGDLRTALLGIRETRGCQELLIKVAATAAFLEQQKQAQNRPRPKLVWYDQAGQDKNE
jgi:hypothetical protein